MGAGFDTLKLKVKRDRVSKWNRGEDIVHGNERFHAHFKSMQYNAVIETARLQACPMLSLCKLRLCFM